MKFFQSVLTAGCGVLALSAANSFATFSYWDPQGTAGGGPTAGIWENNDWSTSTSGQVTPTSYGSGNAADFAVGASAVPAFTVTMNATNTVGGVWNGFNVGACQVTISGPGTMMLSGAQGFYTAATGVSTI